MKSLQKNMEIQGLGVSDHLEVFSENILLFKPPFALINHNTFMKTNLFHD